MSDSEDRERKQQPPCFDPALVIDTRLSEIERQQREEKAEQRKHNLSQRITNWLLTIFTGLLFVTSVVSDILILRQSALPSSALKLPKSAADQAKRAADAAESSATTANNTLKESEGVFRIPQRPYLVAQFPVFNNSALFANQDITANITFKNIGKTPAVSMFKLVDMVPYHGTKDRNDYIKFITSTFVSLRKRNQTGRHELLTNQAREDLAPEATFFSTNKPIQLSETDLRLVLDDAEKTRGSVSLFYVGIISYADSYGTDYDTEFCSFYFGSTLKTWHICDSNNVIK